MNKNDKAFLLICLLSFAIMGVLLLTHKSISQDLAHAWVRSVVADDKLPEFADENLPVPVQE